MFPPLRIRPSLFRRSRLREVTGFSVYASIIDWANKLNYQMDQVVIGVFLGSAAVAVWAPAERIISGVQRMTNQLNGVLFPTIVDSDASQQQRAAAADPPRRARGCRWRWSCRSPPR